VLRGYVSPVTQVIALEGFIAAPGKAAAAGELVELTTSAANLLIAMGKARLATPEDIEAAENAAPPRDPPSTNPKPPRSR
jgi:hypothetical protein